MSPATQTLAVFLAACAAVSAASAQSCTHDLPEPADFPDDDSGVRASRAPPIAEASTVMYQCPGVKEFEGKSEWALICNSELQYVFTPILPVWPVCQCSGDLSNSKCPQASYTMIYGEDPGEKATMKMNLKFPNTTREWSMVLEMDMDVDLLEPSVLGAGYLPKSANELSINSLSKDDLSKGESNFDVVYTLRNGNEYGTARWRHPCVAKITCEIVDDEVMGTGKLWVIVAIVAAVLVGMMLITFLVVYCLKSLANPSKVEPLDEGNYGDNYVDDDYDPKKDGVTNSTYDLRDMEADEYSARY